MLAACDFGDLAHTGITRKSGEPYILHPIAVSCILANMRLDPETLMAALLHDVVKTLNIQKTILLSDLDKQLQSLLMA